MADQAMAQESVKPAATSADDVVRPPTTSVALDFVDWLSFVITTTFALSVYLFTLAPNVTLEFSGLMSTAAMYGGVAHPPGYPAWTIYSWMWVKLLPFSNIAWRVAVGSAFAASVSCGLTAMMVSHHGNLLLCNKRYNSQLSVEMQSVLRAVYGCVAGLVLGFSGAVWNKAVIAEIWSLSLLLFTGVVFLLGRWMREPKRRRYLCGVFLLFGLLLTSSQELIATMPGLACFIMLGNSRLGRDVSFVLLPLALVLATRSQFGIWLDPYLDRVNGPLLTGFLAVFALAGVILLKTRGIGSEWPTVMLCGFCLLVGVAFHFFVPVAAMTNPPVNHGYARAVEGFAHLLARSQYERVRPTADFISFLKQLLLYLRAAGREFGWLQLLLALIPFAVLRRLDPMNRKWLLGLLAVFVGVGPLLLAMLNPPSDLQAIALIRPYFAVSYAVLALWFGLGLLLIGKFTARMGETQP